MISQPFRPKSFLDRLSPKQYNSPNHGNSFTSFGEIPLTSTIYDHDGGTQTSSRSIAASGRNGLWIGVQINSGHFGIGTFVQKISANLQRIGTLVGNYSVRIREDDNTIKGTVSLDAGALSTTKTIVEHTLDTVVEIEVDDRITVELEIGDVSNFIDLATLNVETFDPDTTQEAWSGSSWAASGARPVLWTFDSDPTI